MWFHEGWIYWLDQVVGRFIFGTSRFLHWRHFRGWSLSWVHLSDISQSRKTGKLRGRNTPLFAANSSRQVPSRCRWAIPPRSVPFVFAGRFSTASFLAHSSVFRKLLLLPVFLLPPKHCPRHFVLFMFGLYRIDYRFKPLTFPSAWTFQVTIMHQRPEPWELPRVLPDFIKGFFFKSFLHLANVTFCEGTFFPYSSRILVSGASVWIT